jgi:hypothetical protein
MLDGVPPENSRAHIQMATRIVAYCVIGLPVAVGTERLAPRMSRRRAVLYGGLLGATLAALPPSLFLYPMTGPAGFLAGAISMAVYVQLLKVVARPDAEFPSALTSLNSPKLPYMKT